MTDLNTIKEFTEALRATESGTKPYDTSAEVIRVDGSTAWVHIPGGVDETPVQLSIDAKPGDSVNVRVSGGRAWITGNGSRPPTDDTRANAAHHTAHVAQATAEEAQETAEAAQAAAQATRNYFWHDANGAHVATTEGDATTGNNVLIDSEGMSIRDGVTELAAFLADAIRLGGLSCSITLCGDSSKMSASTNQTGGSHFYVTAKPPDDSATTATQARLCLEADTAVESKTKNANRAVINLDTSLSNGDVIGSLISLNALTSITLTLQGGPVFGMSQQGTLFNAKNQSVSIINASDFTVNGNGMMPLCGVSTNLNNATASGFYSYENSASHIPTSTGGCLMVMYYSSNYVHQLAMPNNGNGTSRLYTRIKTSSGWGEWSEK